MTSKLPQSKTKTPLTNSNDINHTINYLSQAMSPNIGNGKFNVDITSPVIVNNNDNNINDTNKNNKNNTENVYQKESSLSLHTKFPDTFNPRKESNMHHTDKVNKWIINVPNIPLDNEGKYWENNCYDPTIASADNYEDEKTEEMDISNDIDVLEFQSRKITFLVNKAYYCDYEKVRKEDGRLEDNFIECKVHHPNYEITNFPNILNCTQYKPYNIQ